MENILVISNILLWVVVVFLALLILALVRKVNSFTTMDMTPQQPDMLEVGSEAPTFSVRQLDGTEVTNQDYPNKEIAMIFISSNCGPCREKIPQLQELYLKAEKAGIAMLVLNMEDVERTRSFAEEIQLEMPLFALPTGSNLINQTFKVPGTPSYYIIDRKGNISSAGFLDNKWNEITAKW